MHKQGKAEFTQKNIINKPKTIYRFSQFIKGKSVSQTKNQNQQRDKENEKGNTAIKA